MYTPRQIGIPAHARGKITYRETPPPQQFDKIVYCTWELRTLTPLANNFHYLILPDACGDIIFDMKASNPDDGVFAMMSATDADEINLGKSFYYRGIRFLPGAVTKEQLSDIATRPITQAAWQQLIAEKEAEAPLYDYVQYLLANGLIVSNHLMHSVLKHSQDLHSVGQLETFTGYTRRQLQRIFREQTGYSPHDFLKILRFQNAIANKQHYYADQSHYIREFRRITGITPRVFKTKY